MARREHKGGARARGQVVRVRVAEPTSRRVVCGMGLQAHNPRRGRRRAGSRCADEVGQNWRGRVHRRRWTRTSRARSDLSRVEDYPGHRHEQRQHQQQHRQDPNSHRERSRDAKPDHIILLASRRLGNVGVPPEKCAAALANPLNFAFCPSAASELGAEDWATTTTTVRRLLARPARNARRVLVSLALAEQRATTTTTTSSSIPFLPDWLSRSIVARFLCS